MEEITHTNLGNIMYIYEIIKKHTDSENILSVTDIARLIDIEYKEKIDVRTIRRNINVLIEKLDIDISTYNENKKGYFLRTKDFEMSEIKMLIDLVVYSKFMEDKFSKDIVERLKILLSIHEKEVLDYVENYDLYSKNAKTLNKEVLNNIEVLSKSIKEKKKIFFDYFKYGLDKKLKVNKNKIVSPCGLICENEFYYLIAYNEKYNDYSFFRLDKIKNIKNSNLPIVEPNQKINDFVKSCVYMYGGESEKVVLKCNIDILDHVLEKFGKDVEIETIDSMYFKVTLKVNVVGLRMWIMQYIECVDVLYPKHLKDEIREMLKEALKRY